MDRREALVAVSAGQLALGIVGQVVAVRRGLAYDVPLVRMHGRPGDVARDSVLSGTALSAPVVMLACQGVATARLSAGPSTWARRTLGALGALMVGGYLGERQVQSRLRRGGWDLAESSTALAGLSLAVGMAVLAPLPRAGAHGHPGDG